MTDISLKEVVLNKENVITILSFYLQKLQAKGIFTKMGDSSSIFRAIQVFKGEEKELNEKQAAQIMISGVLSGQSVGMYSLEESHILHSKFIPFLQQLVNAEVKPEAAEKVV